MIAIQFVTSPAHGTAVATEVSARPGKSLMEAAVAADIEGIAADCGGAMTCATCHVYVREPWASRLPPPKPEEMAMLEFAAMPRRSNSRLSCPIMLTAALAGITVDLPESQY